MLIDPSCILTNTPHGPVLSSTPTLQQREAESIRPQRYAEEGDVYERGYLLDEVSGAVSFGQVDLLAEGDVGGLGGDLPAVLALELRSSTEKRASKPRDQRLSRSM